MKRKIALKRLSASDLTFFEVHFRQTAGTKQKAFNLDRSVLVDRLFPSLPEAAGGMKVPISLNVHGPGITQSQELQRKVLKQQKNWRLNGELIFSPPEGPERYGVLEPGDFALFDFVGELKPVAAQMFLISQKSPEDKDLHSALTDRYQNALSAHKSMLHLSVEEITNVIEAVGLSEHHPLRGILDQNALEDAALGGIEGVRKLSARRGGRGVSREELAASRKAAEDTGRLGEEAISEYFEHLKSDGTLSTFSWIADENAISPYDFEVETTDGNKRLIEVKSTSGPFDNRVHISLSELLKMCEEDTSYDIYRVYELSDFHGKLRIAQNVKGFADPIVAILSQLPEGISAAGVSIKPDLLGFGDEVLIDLPEDE